MERPFSRFERKCLLSCARALWLAGRCACLLPVLRVVVRWCGLGRLLGPVVVRGLLFVCALLA